MSEIIVSVGHGAHVPKHNPSKIVRRILGFTAVPLVSAVGPFVLLPVVARVGGASAWAALGVGQSVGIVGSTLALWGWWVLGPIRISRVGSLSERSKVYIESLEERILVFALVGPLSAFVAAWISPNDQAMFAGLVCLASTAVGLSPSWYSVAVGKPLQMALFWDVPQAVGLCVSAFSVWYTGNVLFYPCVGLALGLILPLIFKRHIGATWKDGYPTVGGLFRGLRDSAIVACTNIVGTGYTATPVPIATSMFGQVAVAGFISVNKIYRLGTLGISALANALQPWVLEGNRRRPRRQVVAILLHLSLGLFGLFFLSFLAEPFSALLFGDELKSSRGQGVVFGAVFLFLSVSTPMSRNILLPAGWMSLTFRTGVLSAIVGVSCMVGLGRLLGPIGVAIGLLVSEGLVCLVLSIGAWLCWKKGVD